MKVLIIEDDQIIILYLKRELIRNGYKVVGVSDNAEEGIKLIGNFNPDLVLLDIGLQGSLDGIELGLKLKNQYQIPFVFITGNADKVKNDPRIDVSDPVDILSKPISNIKLLEILSNVKAGLGGAN